LFDQELNLIGITTFKSPGPQGYFYSLPVEWIKRLLTTQELDSLNTNETPFWALSYEKQPYFMQVVIPFQNREWQTLNRISTEWSNKEPMTADAWYFLGQSEIGLNNAERAKTDFEKVIYLNPRHLDALKNLYKLAIQDKDFIALQKIKMKIASIDNALLQELEKNNAEARVSP